MLTFVQKRGNTTFYEWRTGKTPTVVEKPVVEEASADVIAEETVGLIIARNQLASCVHNTRKAQINISLCVLQFIIL